MHEQLALKSIRTQPTTAQTSYMSITLFLNFLSRIPLTSPPLLPLLPPHLACLSSHQSFTTSHTVLSHLHRTILTRPHRSHAKGIHRQQLRHQQPGKKGVSFRFSMPVRSSKEHRAEDVCILSSQGNHYCSRDYGSSASNSNSYHYR